jgi:hypothetical protein
LNNESLNNSHEANILKPKGIHGENNYYSHSPSIFAHDNYQNINKEVQKSLFNNISFYPAP